MASGKSAEMPSEGDDRVDAAVRGVEGIFHSPRTTLLGRQVGRKAGAIQFDPDDGLPLLLENGGSGADARSGTDDEVGTGPGAASRRR